MMNPRSRMLSLLRHHGLLPVLLSSAVAVVMLHFRLEWSGRRSFIFLVWNLFLAWVPYGLALLAGLLQARGQARWWNLLPLGGAWLLAFPNAPYLLTDFIHLKPAQSEAVRALLNQILGDHANLVLAVHEHGNQRRPLPPGRVGGDQLFNALLQLR